VMFCDIPQPRSRLVSLPLLIGELSEVGGGGCGVWRRGLIEICRHCFWV